MAKDCTNVAITKTISTRVSSQCPDTGIQVAHKQTNIESGYNVLDYVKLKTGSQCQALG
ncbi:hypothetical protein [Wolbachia endosymbiont (group A) of Brachyopa scutellaris]|uniref:hypothetical protein n=1 Tax=Wolbachia endosymbiont (group A) of Brachyopa scutellaris TaxID=3066140 RepID=UPI003132F251